MTRRLSKRFYQRPTAVVARALLGKVLVYGNAQARITECEAYLGPEDLASHARFGRTPRNEVMFGAGGHAYVYLCYGIHYMFNVVSDKEGEAGAVLIRGVSLLDESKPALVRTDGPGKLTRALGLDMRHNYADLTGAGDLYIHAGPGSRRVHPDDVVIGPRIGIDYAGSWMSAPLRFCLR